MVKSVEYLRIENLIFGVFTLFFLMYPLIYYIIPDIHYSKELSWVVIARSIVSVIMIFLAIGFTHKASYTFWMAASFLLLISTFFSVYRLALGEVNVFFMVVLPMLFFIISIRYTWLDARPWFIVFSIINSFFIIFDFFVLGSFFAKFDYGEYYRPVGISINPNISGIVSSIFLLISIRDRRYLFAGLSALCILLTGSKTAYVLAFLVIIFSIPFKKLKPYIFFLCFFVIAILIFLLYYFFWSGELYVEIPKLRSFSLESLYIRLSDYSELLDELKVFNYGESPFSIDNGFLSKIIFGGLFFASFWYLLYFFCLINSCGETRFILFILLISSVTTNIYYTWPLGYFMYFLMGSSLMKRERFCYGYEK